MTYVPPNAHLARRLLDLLEKAGTEPVGAALDALGLTLEEALEQAA